MYTWTGQNNIKSFHLSSFGQLLPVVASISCFLVLWLVCRKGLCFSSHRSCKEIISFGTICHQLWCHGRSHWDTFFPCVNFFYSFWWTCMTWFLALSHCQMTGWITGIPNKVAHWIYCICQMYITCVCHWMNSFCFFFTINLNGCEFISPQTNQRCPWHLPQEV